MVVAEHRASATTCTAWQTFLNQSSRRVRNATLPPPTVSVTTGADVVAITVAGGSVAARAVAADVNGDIVASNVPGRKLSVPGCRM